MWQDVKNRAATTCSEYIQDAGLLGPSPSSQSSQKIQTWVPNTLKAQIAAYALQWHRALPLKGIIIGQTPTTYDKGSPSTVETAPPLAASFAFCESCEIPATSEILANEISLCGKDRNGVLEAIRDCWNLVDHGVLSIFALPLGMENRFDWSPATESDTLQMQILARCLCDLISLSAEMGPRGTTIVVAMGRWAHDLSSELRRQFNEKLHEGRSKYWTLDIRASLYHPARTWHKYNSRNHDQITMGREDELLLLHNLLMSGRDLSQTTENQQANRNMKTNAVGYTNGNGGGFQSKSGGVAKTVFEHPTRNNGYDDVNEKSNYNFERSTRNNGSDDVNENSLSTNHTIPVAPQFRRPHIDRMSEKTYNCDSDDSSVTMTSHY